MESGAAVWMSTRAATVSEELEERVKAGELHALFTRE